MLPVGWEHVDFAALRKTLKKSHSGTEITPSSPHAEAQSDALRGEDNTEDEQRRGSHSRIKVPERAQSLKADLAPGNVVLNGHCCLAIPIPIDIIAPQKCIIMI